MTFRIEHYGRRYPFTVENALYLSASVVCSFLSVIPSYRYQASMATRSVALIGSLHSMMDAKNVLSSVAKCARVGCIALGMYAVAVSMPHLVVASLAADVGLRMIEAFVGDGKFPPLHVIALDLAMIAAITRESLPFMITANVINLFVMVGYLHYSLEKICSLQGNEYEILCHLILTALNLVSMFQIIGKGYRYGHCQFLIQNDKDHELFFRDKNGVIVGSAKPGEQASFTLPSYKTWMSGFRSGNFYDPKRFAVRGSDFSSEYIPTDFGKLFMASSCEKSEMIWQHNPIDVKDYPQITYPQVASIVWDHCIKP
jgi:hypothetical protein